MGFLILLAIYVTCGSAAGYVYGMSEIDPEDRYSDNSYDGHLPGLLSVLGPVGLLIAANQLAYRAGRHEARLKRHQRIERQKELEEVEAEHRKLLRERGIT
jgi:hypothetical protein